ncbi:MAG TPA: cellulose binding domain-containing protein, partial [Polyangiales bacterium]|nr:cellulose binding domain-containing protein [Polyangiales bacterium]
YALQWYRWAYGFSDATNSCLADRMQQAIGASDGSLNSIVSILTQADGFLAREGVQDSLPASTASGAPTTSTPPPMVAGDAGAATMMAPDASAPAAPPNLTVTLTVDNEWDQGFCKTYELHNTGTTPITWSVPLDVTGTMNNHWECQVSGSTGRVTFTGEDYNQTLQPDAKVQFGYCVAK